MSFGLQRDNKIFFRELSPNIKAFKLQEIKKKYKVSFETCISHAARTEKMRNVPCRGTVLVKHRHTLEDISKWISGKWNVIIWNEIYLLGIVSSHEHGKDI
jgi:hypothetical protein